MKKTHAFFFIFILVTWPLFSIGQSLEGIPLVENYKTHHYKGEPQNWGIIKDNRGLLMVANNSGLLTYDGNSWKLHDETFNYFVSAITNIRDTIYVGSENDIGILSSDSIGEISFLSLKNQIPDSLQEFGIVRDIFSWNGHVVFHSDQMIGIVAGNNPVFFPSENRIKKVFNYRGNLYVSFEESGFFRFDNGKLMQVPGSHFFEKNKPVAVVMYENDHYFLSEKGGLYHLTLNKFGYEIRIREHDFPLKAVLGGRKIERCDEIKAGLFSINFEEGGLVITKGFREIEATITHESGLQDEIVHGQFMDDFGTLWLALNNGISRVHLGYPLRLFDERNGLEGTVESITSFNEAIYAATNSGIYKKLPEKRNFEIVAPLQAWDFATIQLENESKLLVATNNEIQEISPKDNLELILPCYPWMVQQSTLNPNLVYVGLDPGIASLYWNGKAWETSQEDYQMEEQINNLTEFEGRVYYGTRSKGFFEGDLPKWYSDSADFGQIIPHESNELYNTGPIYTASFLGDMLFGTTAGIRSPMWSFDVDTTFGTRNSKPHIHRLQAHPIKQELWAALYTSSNTWQIGFFDSLKNWNYRFFNPVAQDMVHSFLQMKDGKVWLGGPSGVFESDLRTDFNIETPFNTLIRSVIVNEDSLIFSGNWINEKGVFSLNQPKSDIPEFHYTSDGIRFEFGALSMGEKEDMKYSYWLEGNDDKWSKWNLDHKKEYTNLPPGNYTFKVKALNIFETESSVAEYRFVILKPWFETTWYYAGQTTFFLVLVFLTFFLSRSGRSDNLASIIAFVTIITIFEYLIMTIEPLFQEYTGEIPIFNLLMNVLLAMSLVPLELYIKKALAKRHKQEGHDEN